MVKNRKRFASPKRNPPSKTSTEVSSGNLELAIGVALLGGAAAAGVYYLYTRNRASIQKLGSGISGAVSSGTTALTSTASTAASTVTTPIRQGVETVSNIISGSSQQPVAATPSRPDPVAALPAPVPVQLPTTNINPQPALDEQSGAAITQRASTDPYGRTPEEIRANVTADDLEVTKALLNAYRYPLISGGSSLDSNDRAQIIAFQRAYNAEMAAGRRSGWTPRSLTVDGILGRNTLKAVANHVRVVRPFTGRELAVQRGLLEPFVAKWNR